MKKSILILIMLILPLAVFSQRRSQADNNAKREKRQESTTKQQGVTNSQTPNPSEQKKETNASSQKVQTKDQGPVNPGESGRSSRNTQSVGQGIQTNVSGQKAQTKDQSSGNTQNAGYRRSQSNPSSGQSGETKTGAQKVQTKDQSSGNTQSAGNKRGTTNPASGQSYQGQDKNKAVPSQSNDKSRGQRYDSRQQNVPQSKYTAVNNTPRHQKVIHQYKEKPQSVQIRKTQYPYRQPVQHTIIWSVSMCNNYRLWYPEFNNWHYNYGYHIPYVTAYDAWNYPGEVIRTYGRVYEAYYSNVDRLVFLYFGAYYPYQDLTIVIPSNIAFRYSRNPVRFFQHRYVTGTGLVTFYDKQPEIWIKERQQLSIY